MSKETIKCRECECVNEQESKCGITGRDIKLDSDRKCKLARRKKIAIS